MSLQFYLCGVFFLAEGVALVIVVDIVEIEEILVMHFRFPFHSLSSYCFKRLLFSFLVANIAKEIGSSEFF